MTSEFLFKKYFNFFNYRAVCFFELQKIYCLIADTFYYIMNLNGIESELEAECP